MVEISRMNRTGRPVLVGTTSVEQSDALSEQLHEAGIPHEVRSEEYSCAEGISVRMNLKIKLYFV